MSKDAGIPLTKVLMDQAETEAVAGVLRSGWITQGPEVARFEEDFKAYAGTPFACAVSSCTTALHVALLALGVQPGDEVITVSHSFVATANSVRYCGAVPVFVDVDPGTFNINPSLIDKGVTPKTRAILCVHQMGMPCDLTSITTVAKKHGLPVIEDAACAIGSEILWRGKWEKIGRPHGDIACFSFHPRKVMTTGEGGMLTTANPSYDQKFRLLRHHGMSVSDTARHQAKDVVIESYLLMGYNYRMTDIQAAIGREQMKKLPQVLKERRALAARYKKLLADVPEIALPEEPSWARSNWQSFCLRLGSGVSRNRVIQRMLERKIASKPGIMCAHREPACQKAGKYEALPNSEHATDHGLIIPLYPQMTETEQDAVIQTLKQSIQEAKT